MKLGIGLGYSPRKLKIPMEDILFAEKMGFDSVWAAESMGLILYLLHLTFLLKLQKLKLEQQLCKCRQGHQR